MRTRPVPVAIKALLLLGMGLFLYSRIANGSIYFYINERFIIYTFAAAIILVLVGISYPRRPRTHQHADYQHDEHSHAHMHEHAHGHEHHHTLSWTAVLVLSLPILLGLLVPPKPLGVAALENRELDVTGSELPRAVRPLHNDDASQRNLLEWWQAFQLSSVPNSLVGEDAEVTGFVYHDEQFGQNHFVITRYVVSCCVADATVVGMVVRWPEAEKLENDQWVTVRGQIAGVTQNGLDMPVLAADTIELVAAPQQPYLYP